MRVVLTTLNARFSHSSLALRYLRSRLRAAAHAIQGLQIMMAEYSINERVDYVLGEIYRMKPDLVGFSVYIWNLEPTLALCAKLKQVLPGVVIVLGGPEVSFDSIELLEQNPGLDAVVVGEGEETFYELVRSMSEGDKLDRLDHVPGLVFRGERVIVSTPPRPLIDNLDEVVSPYQGDGVRTGDWGELVNRTVYLEGSRGCFNRCRYCLSSVQPGVRYFPLERVEADLEALIANGATQVKFVDRTFNSSPERAQAIWEYLLQQYEKEESWRKALFHFEIGADRLIRRNLELLKRVPPGYFEFEIGVQSTHPATQEAISRSMDWDRLRENVAALRGWDNIHLHLDLIAGLPFEPYQRFRVSFDDVYRLRPHRLQLGFLKLLKGSGLRESAGQYGYRFSPQPPYELLESRELSFSDILRLRLIEDLVEKYHNPGRFTFSLGILELWADDAMGLYEAMADYWEEKGIYRLTQSGTSTYRILLDFAKHRLRSPIKNIFTEMLKLDWLTQPGMPHLPDWFPRTRFPGQKQLSHQILKDERNMEKHFPEWRGMSAREINKRLLVEFFEYDVIEIARRLEAGSLKREDLIDPAPGISAVGIKAVDSGIEYFRLELPANQTDLIDER
ncbi:MAG: B12-binding domain-containing radical SAM protein [Firmicutes bacterium]|nr:B12-binding domain-containing radical SAM protein [Bacillota bacterium]